MFDPAALGEERDWLVPMAALTAIELLLWFAAWAVGIAPLPLTATYVALGVAGLGMALGLRRLWRPAAARAGWPAILLGTLFIGTGSSLFMALKYAIPAVMPFWLDAPLAAAEAGLFGGDPYLRLDALLGWAALPIDRVYGLWLPVQLVILFSLVIAPPSRAKSRALVAYAAAWFLLGIVAAALLSSAGPIFFDRAFGGARFAALHPLLEARGASMVVATSDAMWAARASGRPGLVAGISAVPSMHVAISLWIVLTARRFAPKAVPLAAAYFGFIWIASVQLGWHYAADGLASIAGMLVIWWAAGKLPYSSSSSS